MPLGFERLNERTQRPNALINFIRPLPGPTVEIATQILNHVAAVCYPFMKNHTILVQALEEFPYNTEFVGRNFNAGEVIQLVLKDRNGRWLPQRMVEMVMVHELAHCKQMNHSKAFWKVRDAYAVDLRALWAKGYTGEGLWGRGRKLYTGNLQNGSVDPGDVPEHLCGGTYGRKSKKRKRGGKGQESLTYAERKQRRIMKKFGAGGQPLGADDDTKVKLEGGVAKKGKPRVAGSARGRDLRAAAALARFDVAIKEPTEIRKEEASSESETEDEIELGDQEAAIDVDGQRMTDEKGRALIKICEDADDHDGHARRERDEIEGLESSEARDSKTSTTASSPAASYQISPQPMEASSTYLKKSVLSKPASSLLPTRGVQPNKPCKRRANSSPEQSIPITKTCVVCSLINELDSITCMACSNVLNPHIVVNHWMCSSAACSDNEYVNSGDVGRCGACATPRGAG